VQAGFERSEPGRATAAVAPLHPGYLGGSAMAGSRRLKLFAALAVFTQLPETAAAHQSFDQSDRRIPQSLPVDSANPGHRIIDFVCSARQAF
jgi:hypothetical protein